MRNVFSRVVVGIVALCLVASGCGRANRTVVPLESTGQPVPAAERAGKPEGPILRGLIRGPSGEGVANVEVVLFGGLATRWRVAQTRTDVGGAYEFAPMHYGASIYDEQAQRWDYYVGMQLEHPELTSADGQSWWDVTVANVAGQVTVRDFQLIEGGAVEGQLVDAETGRPLEAGLRLFLKGAEGDFLRYASTDASGRFRQTALFPGRYVAEVNDPRRGYPVVGEFDVVGGRCTQAKLELASAAESGG